MCRWHGTPLIRGVSATELVKNQNEEENKMKKRDWTSKPHFTFFSITQTPIFTFVGAATSSSVVAIFRWKKTVIREMRNEKSWERGKWKKSEKRKSGESMSDESVKVFIVWKEKWKESTELRKYSHEFMTHESHAKKIEKPVVVSQIHIYSVWFIITFSNINLLLKIIINET